MFSGQQIADLIADLQYSHVIWLPDSLLGQWETSLADDDRFRLLRVCREGEAWPLAAGLMLGGQRPLVMMQITGFFESGDALRNVAFDLQLPITAIVGARSWLNAQSKDSAKQFALPLVEAWGLPYCLIEKPDDLPLMRQQLAGCLETRRPGLALIAEGRM